MIVLTGAEEKKDWIIGIIREWVNTSQENTLDLNFFHRAWDDPLVGFSQGHDSYWASFREHVGPFHWTPAEAFAKAFPRHLVSPKKLTVISWVLPQMQQTKRDTGRENKYPPESWAKARFYGDVANEKLRRYIVEELDKVGIRAMSPVLHQDWSRMPSDKFVYASKWSERHAAFVSGLGTFGLCDGLITSRGKAVRLGSVVAEITLAPTPRPYTNHHAYCLWFSHGTCKKCVQRCPVGAISDKGHDKLVCMKHEHIVCNEYIKEHYGFDGFSCGLCQTAVPCESGIPLQGKAV